MLRGWALLLSAYLFVWVPVNFAVELLGTVPSLRMRGVPAWFELAFHGATAILCATAGRMMRTGAPAALSAATLGVVAAAATAVQSLLWTALPRDIAPGARGPMLALAAATAGLWLFIIARLRRRKRRDEGS